jgi:uncharacterized RDD family membrane protein YckC
MPVYGAETAGMSGMPMGGVAPLTPPLVTATTLPRAGFWIRIIALVIDVVLVAILAKFINELFPHSFRGPGPGMFVLVAVYGAVMWKLKGTTIGGIIFGLKVVRADGRELDWATAIVRALGCFVSLVIVGFGFIWIAIDDDKQSWHDKIAGTLVVRVPKGASLV